MSEKVTFKGVVAVTGAYTNDAGEVELKTSEELKKSVEKQPDIPVLLGHNGPEIGVVTQTWNNTQRKAEGVFTLDKGKLPQHMLEKMERGEEIAISAKYEFAEKINGIMTDIEYRHVAILVSENPKCALGQCGVNVGIDRIFKVTLVDNRIR